MSKGHRPAGGIASNKRVEKPVRYGASGGAIKANIKGVSQIGEMIGNKVTEKAGTLKNTIKPVRAGPMGGMGAIPLGNEVAGRVGPGGPGADRNVYKTGLQSTYGAVASGNPRPKGDLFPGWPAKR